MKNFIIYLVSVLMVFSNTAFAASEKRVIKIADVNEYLKESKIHKKGTTFRHLLTKMKPHLSPSERSAWTMALLPYMDRAIPTTKASWLDDGKGNAKNLKFFVTAADQSFVVEIPENPQVAYRFNGVEVTFKDLKSDGGRAKIVSAMQPHQRITTAVRLKYDGKLLPNHWLRLAKKESLTKYFVELRKLNAALERVTNGQTDAVVQFDLAPKPETYADYLLRCLISPAHASGGFLGSGCAFAGWAGKYEKINNRVSCNFHTNDPSVKGACGSGAKPCNPVIFGRSTQGGGISYAGQGKPFCAVEKPGQAYKDATMQCHNASPISALVSHIKTSANGDDPLAQQMLDDYHFQLQTKIDLCASLPASTKTDQQEACAALEERMVRFNLEKQEVFDSIPVDTPVPVEELGVVGKVGNGDFWSRWGGWIIAGTTAVLGGALVYGLMRDKKKKKDDKGDPIVPVEPVDPIVPVEPVDPIVPPTIPKVDRVEVDEGPTIDLNDRPTRYNELRETVQ